MALYQRIMVAVDFSSYSQTGVDHGVALARPLGATLILVNVINQRDVNTIERVLYGQTDFSVVDYIEQQTRERTRSMEALLDHAGGKDLAVEMAVVVDIPYQGLFDQIREKRADLLIMNTKGRSNLADAVIGSCAQKMYRRCPVPLLSLRPENKKS
ncbi:MAG: universal stress protein [Desulfobacterales bacterium]|jgi:nucleotide-binding universal stress UspA family protein|nr:universal stress protein [Desulfobacterales bacterium]